ncbi:MAG: hypothetical protein O3B13_22690, partial [Planctomycetota bacterium]|nr:hypothetical protein [Planctomycetota bacterium]
MSAVPISATSTAVRFLAGPFGSGAHAVENRHFVTNIHSTVMKQVDRIPHRLEVSERDRVQSDYRKPIDVIDASGLPPSRQDRSFALD